MRDAYFDTNLYDLLDELLQKKITQPFLVRDSLPIESPDAVSFVGE